MIVTLSNLFPEAQMALRAERIAEFISDRLPESGVKVQLLCEDHVGTYTLPFLCLRTEAGWRNASTMTCVDADVLGWRLHGPPAWSSRRGSRP